MAEEVAELKSAPPAVPSRKKKWAKRILKIFGVLFALLLLFILLLPTIISVLPIEGFISRKASDMVPGTIEIKGISLGWISSIKIDGIKLTDNSTPPVVFLEADRFSVEHGLAKIALSADRLGKVRLDNFAVNLQRRKNGDFNFVDFIPPTDPNSPPKPPEPAKPFVLDLDELIPEFPVPTSKLDFKINQIAVNFEDHSTTTSLQYAVDNSYFAVNWNGATSPLTVDFPALVHNGNSRVPVAVDGELKDWVNNGQTTIKNSSFHFAVLADKATAADFSGSIKNKKLNAEAVLDLAGAGKFAALAPAAIQNPVPAGKIRLSTLLDTSENEAITSSSLTLRGIEASTSGTLIALPPASFSVYASLDKKTLARSKVAVGGKSSFLTLNATETPDSTTPELYGVHAELQFIPKTLTDFAEKTIFWNKIYPVVDGVLKFKADGIHRDFIPQKGAAEITWTAKTLKIDKDIFPAAFQPRQNPIPIGAFDFALTAKAAQSADGSIGLTLGLKNQIMPASGSGKYQPSGAGNGELSAQPSLSALNDYLEKNFIMSPAVKLSGEGSLTEHAAYDGRQIAQSGEFAIPDLAVLAAMLPNGEYKDEISAAWAGDTSIATDHQTSATVTLASRYLNADLSTQVSTAGLQSLSLKSTSHLTAIQSAFVSAYVDSQLVTTDGDIIFNADVTSPQPNAYNFDLTLNSSAGLAISSPQYGAGLNGFATHAVGAFTQDNEKMHVKLDEYSIALEDFATAEGTADIVKDGDQIDFTLSNSSALDYQSLFTKFGGMIADRYAIALNGEGSTQLTLTTSGSIKSDPAGMQYLKPVQLAAKMSSNIPTFNYEAETMKATAAGIRDDWDVSVSIIPSDMNSLVLSESTTLTVANISYNDQATVEAMRFQTAGKLSTGMSGEFHIIDTGMDSASYKTATVAAGLPKMRFNQDIKLAGVEHVSTIFDLDSPNFAKFTGNSQYDGAAKKIDWKSELTAELAGLAAAETGDMAEKFIEDPAGSINSKINAAISYKMDQDTTFTLTDYSGDASLGWKDIGFAMPDSYGIAQSSGDFALESTGGGWNLSGEATPGEVSKIGEPQPMFAGIHFITSAALDKSGRLDIYDAGINSEALGATVSLRGMINNVFKIYSDYQAGANSGVPPDYAAFALNIPAQLSLDFSEDLQHAGAILPDLKGSGSVRALATLENIPGFQTRLALSSEAKNATFSYGELAKFTELNGSIPFTRIISHQGGGKSFSQPISRGSFTVKEMVFHKEPYNFVGNDGRLEFFSQGPAFEVTAQAASFLGGAANSKWSLKKAGRDPVLAATLSFTNFDGSTLLPNLKARAIDRRGFDAFGSLSMRLRENTTINSVLDDLVSQMEITNISAPLLRESLRELDRKGANPGIQTTITSLRFASPTRGLINMRGGLFSSSIEMNTAAGAKFAIPLLDRANMSNLLEAYVDPSLNPMTKLLRQSILLLLSDNIQEIRQLAPTGTNQ
ncbi:hypothetical protein BH09SUM1_BH09SUM1_03250 [soil metagenome]